MGDEKLKMKNKKILPTLLYTFGLLLVALFFVTILSDILYISRYVELIILCSSCLFIYFGGITLSKSVKNNEPMKRNIKIFFVIYLILLITLVLFDKDSRNTFTLIFLASKERLNNYLSNKANLIPFATITEYFDSNYAIIGKSLFFENVYGNFIMTSPFAFFLPMIFDKQKKFKNFLIAIIAIVIGIEILQLLTLSGAFDIDDFILNVSGSLVMYGILKIDCINKLIRNVFLLEKNKLNIKKILLVMGVVCVCVFSSMLVFKIILDKCYSNYDNSWYLSNPIIKFKYDEVCSSNNKFYEDDEHEYYLECYDADKFIAIVDNEEYTITDLLDNSKYTTNIKQVLKYMKIDKIKYDVKDK